MNRIQSKPCSSADSTHLSTFLNSQCYVITFIRFLHKKKRLQWMILNGPTVAFGHSIDQIVVHCVALNELNVIAACSLSNSRKEKSQLKCNRRTHARVHKARRESFVCCWTTTAVTNECLLFLPSPFCFPSVLSLQLSLNVKNRDV